MWGKILYKKTAKKRSSLTNIIIPPNVTSIGNYAFNGCNNLTSVEFKNANDWQVDESDLFSNPTNVTISATDFAANATLLRQQTYDTPSGYCDYFWRRLEA